MITTPEDIEYISRLKFGSQFSYTPSARMLIDYGDLRRKIRAANEKD